MSGSPVQNIKKKVLSPAGLIFSVNLLFLFLPVLRYFSYETALLNGVLVTALSGLLYFKNTADEGSIGRSAGSLAIILTIPPLLYFIAHLLRGDCSFVSGLKYYLLFTLTAPVVGIAISSVVLLTGIELKKTIFFVIFILLLFNWVVDFLLYPQFFLFNAIFTYYPGVIYDEFIPVTEKMIYYRLGIVVFSASIILLERKLREEGVTKRMWWGLGILTGVPLLSLPVSSSAGLVTLKEDMTRDFRDSVVTAHFFILSEEKLSPSERYLVAVTHEIYYTQLSEFYGIQPKRVLESIIFKDSGSKKRWLGVENADVAKPWLGTAFTTRGNLDQSLKHELAHLFTAEFGWGPFKVAYLFDPALIEGSATAGDGFVGGYDIDEFVAAVQASKYKVEPASIFPGFGFFDANPTLAYALSGSISRYLVEKEGNAKFRLYHETGDAAGAFGKPFAELLEGWGAGISGIKSSISPEELDLYLERQPLIRKTCPRYLAELMNEAVSLYQNKKFSEAIEVYDEILSSNDSFEAFSGKIACLVLLNRIADALKELKAFDLNGKNYATRGRVNLLKYRVAVLAGDTSTAGEADNWLGRVNTPAVFSGSHRFVKLILAQGINPFVYNVTPAVERLRIMLDLASKTGEPAAYEEITDICFRLLLPFPQINDLKAYEEKLSPAGKLKLCALLARANDPAAVDQVLKGIDQKELPSARDRLKYRIFKAVFEK